MIDRDLQILCVCVCVGNLPEKLHVYAIHKYKPEKHLMQRRFQAAFLYFFREINSPQFLTFGIVTLCWNQDSNTWGSMVWSPETNVSSFLMSQQKIISTE